MSNCYTDHDDRCGECGFPTSGYGVLLDDFGWFHRECLQTCGCRFLWPWSMVSSGEVSRYCAGCAKEGESNDAA